MPTFENSTSSSMAGQEQGKKQVPRNRRRRAWQIAITMLSVLLAVFFLGSFLGLHYYGEKFLRRYLQEKVLESSNGLYHVDFRKLNVNILTGRVVIDSFDLIPDSARYEKLKAGGMASRALYRLSFSSVTIDRVRLRQIYENRRINFRRLTVHHPVLRIVGFRDTTAARHSRWRVVYDDIYPAVSSVFKDFHVDSVMVDDGLFLSTLLPPGGRRSSGEYEFSAILRDVSVNRFSYYNRKRIFYSRDIDLVIHNVEYYLADSLYLLRAKDLGFSLTRSVLYGKQLSLIPNTAMAAKRQVGSGDFYRLDLPAFSIRGIDLYRAMTTREVDIRSVKLDDFTIRAYRNELREENRRSRRQGKKINLAGLYTVVSKDLRYVNIDSLSVKKAVFEFYPGTRERRPELRIGSADLALSGFRLDANTCRDPERIFYSREMELTLDGISLNLRDNVHMINTSRITVSTRKSMVSASRSIIFPGRQKNVPQDAGAPSTMYVRLPGLTFSGIDLKKVFNDRVMIFDRLVIEEPEIRYVSGGAPKNPDPRFRKPEDFFEEGNEDAVYNLLKKYLWIVKGREISIGNGYGRFSKWTGGKEIPLAAATFDLTMQDFLIDSVHGMNQQGYFYSRDFDLDIRSLSIVSPDSTSHLRSGRVHITTGDSLIEAENVEIFKTANPMKFSMRPEKRQALALDFTLGKLHLTGLNHKRLFLDKVVKAREILLDEPTLHLKSSPSLHPEGPAPESQLFSVENYIRNFEIGHCRIKKGSLFYDGHGDRKASYFTLKDIDFTLVNAAMQIPERGKRKGVIRFDSLQLSVFPLRAVVADSSYVVEAQSAQVNSYPADIVLKGFSITPLRHGGEGKDTVNHAAITVPLIRIYGFYFDRAIFDNRWMIDKLWADHPVFNFEINREIEPGTKPAEQAPGGLLRLPPFMETVLVQNITVPRADVSVVYRKQGEIRTFAMKDIRLEADRFRADSSTRANPAKVPLFNAGDISVSAPGFSRVSGNGMYTISFGRFGLSTGKRTAYLDSVAVTPNYPKESFSQKLGYQTDRFEVKIPRIFFSGLDFRELAARRTLRARKMTLGGMTLGAYRDKREPFPAWQRPPMPARMIAGIGFPMAFDTVVLSDGSAVYEEQVGDEPGKIFFDRINATLTGSTTLTGSDTLTGCDTLKLHGTARLMGTAPVETWVRFMAGHPRDSFDLRATIGKTDLTVINPMLSKLIPLAIKRGTATSTEIIRLNGNNTRSQGMMNFRFDHLAVDLLPDRSEPLTPAEQSILEMITNLVLPDSNPDADGKLRPGVIRFERDQTRGFFNFVWKSILSGLKSSLGFNTKEQKEIIRAAKGKK